MALSAQQADVDAAETPRVQQRECDQHGTYLAWWVRSLRGYTGCPTCARVKAASSASTGVVSAAAERPPIGKAEGLRGWLVNANMGGLVSSDPQRAAVYERLHAYVKNASAVLNKGVWAAFVGPTGTGKTYALAALCSALAHSGFSALYARANDIIDRSSRRSLAEPKYGLAQDYDFLLVDECCASRCEHGSFFDIMDERYILGKPVIFCGNAPVYGDTDASIAFGIIGPRLSDRFFERQGKIIRFGWESLRGNHVTPNRSEQDSL